MVELITKMHDPSNVERDDGSRPVTEIVEQEGQKETLRAGDREGLSSLDGPFPRPSTGDRFVARAQGAYFLSFWGRKDGVPNEKIEAYFSDVFRKLSELGPAADRPEK